jgi:hypothetical protein
LRLLLKLTLACIFWSSSALATLTIDGLPYSNVLRPGVSDTMVLTTSSPNDVIIICGYGVINTVGPPNIVSITGGGLTFARRSLIQIATNLGGIFPGYFAMLDCWWAHAPTTLSSTSFIVTYSTPLAEVVTTAWAVSGSSLPATPWDTNISLPSYANDQSGASTTPQTTISTDNTKENMLLWFCDSSNLGFETCGTPAGWSPITQGGSVLVSVRYAFKVLRGKQTGLHLQDDTHGPSTRWDLIVDAIVGELGGGVRPQVWIMEED